MRSLSRLYLLCLIALVASSLSPALARPAAPGPLTLGIEGAGQIRDDEQPAIDDLQPVVAPAPDQAPSPQPAAMLRDMTPGNFGSSLSVLGQSGGLVYLSRQIDPNIAQLWRSDLTPQGSVLLRQFQFTSIQGGGFRQFADLNGRVFVAEQEEAGSGPIIISDGTEAGTGPFGTFWAKELRALAGSRLVFIGGTSSHHTDLWGSDGSVPGTVQLPLTGADGLRRPVYQLIEVGDEVILSVFIRGQDTPSEIWRSDGTIAGTRRIIAMPQGISYMVAGRGPGGDLRIYFVIGRLYNPGPQLWFSDGSAAGTRLVYEAPPGPSSPGFISLRGIANGRVFFSSSDSTGARRLWASDSAPGTATPLWNGQPGGFAAAAQQSIGFAVVHESDGTSRLLRSDGTPQGTSLVATMEGIEDLTPAPGRVYFSGIGAPNTRSLYQADAAGRLTELARFTGPTSGLCTANCAVTAPTGLHPYGDGLLFKGYDELHGSELWRSDGTPAGTGLALDMELRGLYSNPSGFSADGDKIYLSTITGIWRSDGTPAGTTRFVDTAALFGPDHRYPTDLAAENGRVFATTYRATERIGALWVSDGVSATRVLSTSASIALRRFGDRLLIKTGCLGYTDGTASGTGWVQPCVRDWPVELNGQLFALSDQRLVRVAGATAIGIADLSRFPGYDAESDPLLQVGQRLVFRGVYANELWASDGTPAGTGVVRDFQPKYLERGPVAVAGGAAFIPLSHGQSPDRFLVRSDGTPAGTSVVTITQSAEIRLMAPAGDRVLLASVNQSPCAQGSACEIWGSDGTPAGTSRLATLAGRVSALHSVGERALFDEQTAGGPSLWGSDGTAEGTHRLATFPGEQLLFSQAAAVEGALLFVTARPDGSARLWRSDGRPGGTRLVQAGFYVEPRRSQGGAYGFTRLGPQLFFAGDTYAEGAELWSLPDNLAVGPLAMGGAAPGGVASIAIPVIYNAPEGASPAELVVMLDPALTPLGEDGAALAGSELRYSLAGVGYLGRRTIAIRVRLPADAPIGRRYSVSAELRGAPAGDPPADNRATGAVMAARQIYLPLAAR